MKISLSRRIASEFLGTAFLVAAVAGSGIMGDRLGRGQCGSGSPRQHNCHSGCTRRIDLTVRPISGAHLNPVVSMAEAFLRGLPWREALLLRGCASQRRYFGAACANMMFALPLFSLSHHARTGAPLWFSEFVATFGLIMIIRGCSRFEPHWLPIAVACYIAAAYWFTASTSFANPAVTIAPLAERHVRGHSPGGCPSLYHCSSVWRIFSSSPLRVA